MGRYHINRKDYDSTGRVCRKCGVRVWKSDSPKCSYHCFGCGESRCEHETMTASEQTPAVEGTKISNGNVRTEEYCPFCDSLTYNAPDSRMSLCAHCGAEMFPCASCKQEGGCQWSYEDYGCQRFIHTPEWAEKKQAGG